MSEYRWKIAVFETGEGQFGPKFQVQGDVPHQPFFVEKESGPLGIIIDGCQDGDSEQITLCYCIADFTIHEEVVEFYATTKGDAASVVVMCWNEILQAFVQSISV